MPARAKIDVERVVALRAAGESVRAIARALAAAPSSISRILRRPGVEAWVQRERARLGQEARAGEGERDRTSEARELGLGSVKRPEAVWLLVKSGDWGFASARGGSVVMRSFPAGLYLEVDEEVVEFARRAENAQLVLGTGDPPEFDRIRRVRALSEQGAVLAESEVRNGAYRLDLPEGQAAAKILALDENGASIRTGAG